VPQETGELMQAARNPRTHERERNGTEFTRRRKLQKNNSIYLTRNQSS
jgi:hypothetical protein